MGQLRLAIIFVFYWGYQAFMKRYLCVVCGFIYDEKEGCPEEGIAAGTRWDDVPENWTCPECGASKDDFKMIEI